MARLYILSDLEKTEKNEKLVNTALIVIIIVLAALIAFEVVFQFVIAPNLTVRRVVITGSTAIDDSDILRLAGLSENEYYFSFNTEGVERRLNTIPIVRESKCEKVFPDTIRITLTERTPIALAIIDDGKRSIPVAIDEEGVIFKIGKDAAETDLPVFSGLVFKAYEPGTRLPEKLVPFLRELSRIKNTSKKVFDFVSEIKVELSENDDFELLFYMVPYSTRVRASSSVNESMLVYALMVLDVLKKERIERTVKEIDFRSKDIVMKYEGA